MFESSDIIKIDQGPPTIVCLYAKKLCEHKQHFIIETIINLMRHISVDYVLNLDMSGTTISDIQNRMEILEQIRVLFKNSNIKLLECNILNPPYVFTHIFSLVKPLLSEETISKVMIQEKKNVEDCYEWGSLF